MFMRTNRFYFRPIAAALLAVCLVASAKADTIVSFSAIPPTPGFPELAFNGSGLHVGTGAQGTGDGNLPVSSQVAGGLEINTPFNVPFVAGRGQTNNVGGSTTFFDVTLTLSGLSPSAPATTTGPLIAQPLNGGTFDLYSTAAYPSLGTLLLSGTFGSATIDAISPSQSGAVLSNAVTYTGGLIYDAILAGGHIVPSTSGFSFSLNSSTNFSQGATFLNGFTADATGLFSANVVPEPASVILFGLGAIGLIGVARRRRNDRCESPL